MVGRRGAGRRLPRMKEVRTATKDAVRAIRVHPAPRGSGAAGRAIVDGRRGEGGERLTRPRAGRGKRPEGFPPMPQTKDAEPTATAASRRPTHRRATGILRNQRGTARGREGRVARSPRRGPRRVPFGARGRLNSPNQRRFLRAAPRMGQSPSVDGPVQGPRWRGAIWWMASFRDGLPIPPSRAPPAPTSLQVKCFVSRRLPHPRDRRPSPRGLPYRPRTLLEPRQTNIFRRRRRRGPPRPAARPVGAGMAGKACPCAAGSPGRSGL